MVKILGLGKKKNLGQDWILLVQKSQNFEFR